MARSIVTFVGTVRYNNEGRKVVALESAYPGGRNGPRPNATHRVEMIEKWGGLHGIAMRHRVGTLAVARSAW